MINEKDEKDETEQRTRRTAGVMGAAAVGVAAGVAAGALLEEATEPEEATHAPAARDPFDDLVPPAPAAPPAAAEADTPAATAAAEAPPVIDTDDSVSPVATTEPVDVPAAAAAPAPVTPAAHAPAVTEAPAVAPPSATEPPAVTEVPAAPEPPVAEEPVVVEQPAVVVEQPVAEEPLTTPGPLGEQPTEPPAVLPPMNDVILGGGMEPPIVQGGNGNDTIVHPEAPDYHLDNPAAPNDVLPPVPAAPIDPMPMSPLPVAEVPTPAPVVPPALIEIEVFDGPPVSVFDTVTEAWAMVNDRVTQFGKLSMQDIDNDDKIELWQALKQLNPTLTGGPLKLQGMNYHDWTLEKVAGAFDVDLRQLAGMVELESNENMSIADFAQQMSASNVTITPHLISVEVEGTTIQFSSNGEVFIEGTEEGSFQPLSLDEIRTPAGDLPGTYTSLFDYFEQGD